MSMGDAALPQPTAGGFLPMLSVDMAGSFPGALNRPIPATRGSAVPQLHSAIVERLRARIELCRKHHSTCESRFQRSQDENSDREHESTLHLLNIVHQGPGNRKTKGTRSAAQLPEHSSRGNAEQKSKNSTEVESKNPTRLALQGSLRRKLEGCQPAGEHSRRPNGLAAASMGLACKRSRADPVDPGHSGCVFSNGQPQGQQVKVEDVAFGNDLFSLTLRAMKKEPGEASSCGAAYFREEGGGQIDPELQELLDELARSGPPLSELELERLLKQDDAFGLVGAGGPCPQLERPIKTEYIPERAQPPASAGPPLSSMSVPLSSSHKNSAQGLQGSLGIPRALPSWHEVSHAEQLKRMAANWQPSVLSHSQQREQPGWLSAAAQTSTGSIGSRGRFSARSPSLPPAGSGQDKGVSRRLSQLVRHGGSDDPAAPQDRPHAPPCFPDPHLPLSCPPYLPARTANMNQHGPGLHSQSHMRAQDPRSRSLQRPPPEYKQLTVLQPHNYTGGPSTGTNSPQQLTSTVPSLGGLQASEGLQTNASLNPPAQAAAAVATTTSPTDDKFLSCFQQPGSQNKNGPQPKELSDPEGTLGSSLALYPQSASEGTMAPAKQRQDGVVANAEVLPPAGWGRGRGLKNTPVLPAGGTQRFPDAPLNHQGRHVDLGDHRFSRTAAPLDFGPYPAGRTFNGQAVSWGSETRSSQETTLGQGQPMHATTPDRHPGPYGSQLMFDFLPEGDGIIPGINTDSDFIESLLKSGPANDDWMKDINLDEILGHHS